MRTAHLWRWMLLCIGVAGCSSQTVDPCVGLDGSYELQFVGAAAAKGRLRLKSAATNITRYQARIALRDIKETAVEPQRAAVSLTGVCSCEQGLVAIEFGSGSIQTVSGKMRVLGGKISGVLRKQLPDGSFGRWKLSILDAKTGKREQLQGFWQEISQDATRGPEVARKGAAKAQKP